MADLEVQQLLSLAEALTLPDAGYSASRLDRLAVVAVDAHDRRQEGPAVGGVDLVTPQPLPLRPCDRKWKTIGPCAKQMEVWTDPSILALSGMKMLIQTP